MIVDYIIISLKLKKMRKIQLATGLLWMSALFNISVAGNNPEVINPQQNPSQKTFRMDSRLKAGKDYLPKTLIFKVKNQYRQNCRLNSVNDLPRLEPLMKTIGVKKIGKIYPDSRPPAERTNGLSGEMVDLSLIYSLEYTADLTVESIINKMRAMGYFEYVEPKYIPKLQYVPNDPLYTNAGQYFCKGNIVGSINCEQAWDITKGDPNVVIGIVDSGTDPNHLDLKANYAGGYDVAMNDADPTWEAIDHGVAVSGDAAAVTDNGIGVAGPGFNCKFKAIKISDKNGVLIAAFEGIRWAADNGCKIINCSWGGSSHSQYEQDIINYAAINKNCLIVSSAGNSGKMESLYPNSYNNVYSVGASNSKDEVAAFSTYGYAVDFLAPGEGIYSTSGTDSSGYASNDGTSMASPVAAGAAALIQSKFNYTNPMQIGERLRQTCDPLAITGVNNTDSLYKNGYLGKGRINVYRALTEQNLKSLVISPIAITDGGDDVFMPAETLSISATFTNYLDALNNAVATLSVASVSAGNAPQILGGGMFNLGPLATLAAKNNNTAPFKIVLDPSVPINQVVTFVITVTDGSYTEKQYISIDVNEDCIDVTVNDVFTTISSTGIIGTNKSLDLPRRKGLGFQYQLMPSGSEKDILPEMSLMIGVSADQVSDNFKELDFGTIYPYSDFARVKRVNRIPNSSVADFQAVGDFNDSVAKNSKPLPVMINQNIFAWSDVPYRKFILLKYLIKNTGTVSLNNLYAGIMADWDVQDYSSNKASYDSIYHMGYCYKAGNNGTYAGIQQLSAYKTNCYTIDKAPNGNGGVEVFDGMIYSFNTSEKYTVLSTSRKNDLFAATGGDVMQCVSAGPFNINPGSSAEVTFAIIAGDNLADLQNSACAAQKKYNNSCIVTSVEDINENGLDLIIAPNPASSYIDVNYNGTSSNSSIRIINLLGEVMATFGNMDTGNNTIHMDVSSLVPGIYFCQLQAGNEVLTKKFIVNK